VGSVERFETLFHGQSRAEHSEERDRRLALTRVVVPLVRDVDVVRLDVEDELVLGPLFLEGFLILDFGGVHLVARAVNLIHRQQGSRHAAARAEKLAAA
jgi:hypothetical protein